jgi:hypothetical protein
LIIKYTIPKTKSVINPAITAASSTLLVSIVFVVVFLTQDGATEKKINHQNTIDTTNIKIIIPNQLHRESQTPILGP